MPLLWHAQRRDASYVGPVCGLYLWTGLCLRTDGYDAKKRRREEAATWDARSSPVRPPCRSRQQRHGGRQQRSGQIARLATQRAAPPSSWSGSIASRHRGMRCRTHLLRGAGSRWAWAALPGARSRSSGIHGWQCRGRQAPGQQEDPTRDMPRLEQLARSRVRHGLCRDATYACVFDRPERTLGASSG
jgi:hypothetical protein